MTRFILGAIQLFVGLLLLVLGVAYIITAQNVEQLTQLIGVTFVGVALVLLFLFFYPRKTRA